MMVTRCIDNETHLFRKLDPIYDKPMHFEYYSGLKILGYKLFCTKCLLVVELLTTKEEPKK